MPTCTTASSRTWWSNTNDLKCPPRCSGKTSCGTQRPFRALSGTHVLLAAAPTTPSCFCRRQRSSLLQRKYYFRFCKSGRAAAPPDLPFHGKGRSGQRHRGCCWPAAKTQREQVFLRDEPSQSRIRSTAPPKGGAYRAFGKNKKLPPRERLPPVGGRWQSQKGEQLAKPQGFA